MFKDVAKGVGVSLATGFIVSIVSEGLSYIFSSNLTLEEMEGHLKSNPAADEEFFQYVVKLSKNEHVSRKRKRELYCNKYNSLVLQHGINAPLAD